MEKPENEVSSLHKPGGGCRRARQRSARTAELEEIVSLRAEKEEMRSLRAHEMSLSRKKTARSNGNEYLVAHIVRRRFDARSNAHLRESRNDI